MPAYRRHDPPPFSEISTLALLTMAAGRRHGAGGLPDIEVGKPKRPGRRLSRTPPCRACLRVALPTPHRRPRSWSHAQSEVERAEEKFNETQKASSELFTTGKEVNALPFARPGDALEIVPGLVVTQHSGEGKANQYYLRGFNLDHGTDLALTLDGMPLNMRTHGHGQGYADANFLIPELFSYILAQKGPYFAEDGDFSSAGAIYMQYKDELPDRLLFGHWRQFRLWPSARHYSDKVRRRHLLARSSSTSTMGLGPRRQYAQDQRRVALVARHGRKRRVDHLHGLRQPLVWDEPNSERAVSEGVISLWGNIDPTDGGDTSRFWLSTRWSETDANSHRASKPMRSIRRSICLTTSTIS